MSVIFEKRFNINDVDWDDVTKLVDDRYHELVKVEFGGNDDVYGLLKNTSATDFIYVYPYCEDPVYELDRNDDFFGRSATELTKYLQSILLEKYKVPENHARNIFLRSLPSPLHHSCYRWVNSCDGYGVAAFVDFCS